MSIRPIPMIFFVAVSLACGGDPGQEVTDAEVPSDRTELSNEIVAGELGVVVAGDDTVISGVVLTIRGIDGATSHGIFRGPPKLAEVMFGGTYEVSADSLHSRVYVLGEGERLVRAAR